MDASHKFFILENNRCILCRRCVRACDELVGNFTLGVDERGADSLIVADLGVPLGESTCISCGMCVEVCPTGALIDRQSAYKGRDTQVEHHPTLCVGCSVGCGVDAITRDNHLSFASTAIGMIRSAAVSYARPGVSTPWRMAANASSPPWCARTARSKAATWDEALKTITEAIKPQAGKDKGLAAVVSTRLPAEALYQFKSLFADGLKSGMVTTTEDGMPTRGVSALARELKQPFEGKLDDLRTLRLRVGRGRRSAEQTPGGRFLHQAQPPEWHAPDRDRSPGE